MHDKILFGEFQKTIHPDRSSDVNYSIANEIIGKTKFKPNGTQIRVTKNNKNNSVRIEDINHHKGTKKTTILESDSNKSHTKTTITDRRDGSSRETFFLDDKKIMQKITNSDGSEVQELFTEDHKIPFSIQTTSHDAKTVTVEFFDEETGQRTAKNDYTTKGHTKTTFQSDGKTPAKIETFQR